MRNLPLVVCLAISLAAVAHADPADRAQPASEPTQTRIRPAIVMLPAAWTSQIPPTGNVNAPAFLTTVHPGQPLALGVLADGPERNKLLEALQLEVRISPVDAPGDAAATRLPPGKPITVRHLKAQGADAVLHVLEAAKIAPAERGQLEAATSVVSLAVFPTTWTVPNVDRPSVIEIAVTRIDATNAASFTPLRLNVRPTADWFDQPLPTDEELGRSMNRVNQDLPPGQLLAFFRSAVKHRRIQKTPVDAFFAYAFAHRPIARDAAVAAYPRLDPDAQTALLRVFRLGGQDLRALFPQLPSATFAPFAGMKPLPDARKLPRFKDPIAPADVSTIGVRFDLCWAAWTATGDKTYLHALVDQLQGAPDYPAFKAWSDSRGGAKGLNAQVARGLAYQVAGWSIASFQRADPLVADWLHFWRDDPSLPASLREEITSLPTNPAFRRK